MEIRLLHSTDDNNKQTSRRLKLPHCSWLAGDWEPAAPLTQSACTHAACQARRRASVRSSRAGRAVAGRTTGSRRPGTRPNRAGRRPLDTWASSGGYAGRRGQARPRAAAAYLATSRAVSCSTRCWPLRRAAAAKTHGGRVSFCRPPFLEAPDSVRPAPRPFRTPLHRCGCASTGCAPRTQPPLSASPAAALAAQPATRQPDAGRTRSPRPLPFPACPSFAVRFISFPFLPFSPLSVASPPAAMPSSEDT
jgi:hypothetical protein